MVALLATDPVPARNTIAGCSSWAVGAVILWIATTLLLRDGSIDTSDGRDGGHA